MKTNFTRLLSLAALCLITFNLSAQDAYRSAYAGGSRTWATIANWQRFDVPSSTWVPATVSPTSADGTILISASDSIQLTGVSTSISIDQVTIATGGVLVIFNNTGTVTVNNGAGDDIIVNGRLYVAAGTTVSGTGTIQVNAGGDFTLRNSGILSVPVTSSGTLYFGQVTPANPAGTVSSGTTITNNGHAYWLNGKMTLGGAIVNNGTLHLVHPSAVTTNDGTGSFTNNGTLLQESAFGYTFAAVQTFTNASTGVIGGGGAGQITFAGTFNNTGHVSPGASPGILTASNNILSGTPTLDIEISSAGAVAGTNYDRLVTPGAVNITTTTLNVTQVNNADPVNTTYDFIVAGAPIVGTAFAAQTIPSNYTLSVSGNTATLTKIALFPLPVVWGDFTAVANGTKVALKWTTLSESNTSHFVIEHATGNGTFVPVANVPAQLNTDYKTNYSYVFAAPDLQKTNLFRIRQFDQDGHNTLSATRSVKFEKGLVVAIQAYPNPVKDNLTLNVQAENIRVILSDLSGRIIKDMSVQPGQHNIDMQNLPSGVYQLGFYESGIKKEVRQIVKQ